VISHPRVRVPGSSANLGPGFDALALGLGLYLDVSAKPRSSGERVKLSGAYSAGLPTDDSNLIWQSFLQAFKMAGRVAPDVTLAANNEIPLGRGLGSSGAAAVAGVALANRAGELGFTPMQVLMLAVEIEGHPDNVAASALGGLAVVAPPHQAISLPWPPAVSVVVAVPEVQLATSRARAALPLQYDRHDAVFNLQRATLLVAAISSWGASGSAAALRVALQDRWHQPYRAPLVPGLNDALTLECPGLYGVALSGAGPSIIAFVDAAHSAPTRVALGNIYRDAGIAGEIRELAVAPRGVDYC